MKFERNAMIDECSGQVLVHVTHKNTTLIFELEEDGWHCYIHSDSDPRNKLGGHPAKLVSTNCSGSLVATCVDASEIADYRLYLGCVVGNAFPHEKRLTQMFGSAQFCGGDFKFGPTKMNPTYADLIGRYSRYPLSDDEWLKLNQFDWKGE